MSKEPVDKVSAADVAPVKKVRVEKGTIVAVKHGAVGFWDKAKNWYKSAIVFLGVALVVVNQLTPLFDFLPTNWHHGLSVAVAIATWLLATLKSNEKWIDAGQLPNLSANLALPVVPTKEEQP